MRRQLPWMLAFAAGAALADEPRTWFRLSATAGTQHTASRDTDYGGDVVGPDIRYEEDLGVARHGTVLGLGFGRRIGQAWRVEVEGWRDRRRGSTTLAADTRVGGQTYAAGTRLDTTLRVRQLRVNAGYTALKSEDLEAGVLVGGQVLQLGRQLRGTYLSGFENTWDTSDSAPMPVVGAFGEGRFGEGFGWNARGVAALGTTYRSLAADLLWRPHPMFTFGLGWRWLRADVDVRWGLVAGVERFLLDYRQHGPHAFAQFAF